MNNSFSISRFALLLKKDFTENIRLYAIGSVSLLLGLATLMVIFTPLMCMPAEEGGAIFATFPIYWLFSFALCIAASMMFPQLRTKQGRVSLFMLPLIRRNILSRFLPISSVLLLCSWLVSMQPKA